MKPSENTGGKEELGRWRRGRALFPTPGPMQGSSVLCCTVLSCKTLPSILGKVGLGAQRLRSYASVSLLTLKRNDLGWDVKGGLTSVFFSFMF